MNEDLESRLKEFITYRIGHNDAISTAERRARRIKTLSKSLNIEKPDMVEIYRYVERRQREGVKKKSLRIELMDLEHWFSFNGHEARMPRLKKEPSPDPYVPTPEEVEKILDYCYNHFHKEIWSRNALVIRVFASTGVRIGEFERINIEDVDFERKLLHVRSEKGEKDRYVPIKTAVLEEIRRYIDQYRMDSDARALFTTEKGRMPYGYIRTMVKKLGAKLNMKGLHPHSFRHFYLSQLYALTDDLRLVQILAGHARIDSTTIYEHMSTFKAAEKGRSAVEKFFREGEDLNLKVQKNMGVATNRWAHWDSDFLVGFAPMEGAI